jgi:hypothetical protein
LTPAGVPATGLPAAGAPAAGVSAAGAPEAAGDRDAAVAAVSNTVELAPGDAAELAPPEAAKAAAPPPTSTAPAATATAILRRVKRANGWNDMTLSFVSARGSRR